MCQVHLLLTRVFRTSTQNLKVDVLLQKFSKITDLAKATPFEFGAARSRLPNNSRLHCWSVPSSIVQEREVNHK